MVVTGEVAGLKDSADPQSELVGLRAVRAGGSDPQFGAGRFVRLACCWRSRCRPCHERRRSGLAAFVEIKQAVLRLSAPQHRRSTTPSAGPADGQWGKLLAVEPHGLFLMCGSTIRWGKPCGRAQLGTARHCSQQLA